MRILITGSSGQLGSEIARQLWTEHEVVGVDLAPGPWTAHVGSITDQELMSGLVRGVDAVIHTASLHAPHVSLLPKQAFVDTNISGTLHLLEAAARAHIRRFVYTSTTSVYGAALVPAERAVWVTEDLGTRPRDIYDITKVAAEQLCAQFAVEYGLPVICLRVSRFFDEEPDVATIHRLYRGADVRDIAAAHVLAVMNEDIQYGLYNVSARSPFVLHDLADLLRDAPSVISRYAPKAADIFQELGWKLPGSIDRVYVIEKAERELGYATRYNFAERLQEILPT
ncbi:MAG: NAD-dependent epimerase/dehydratase family protein [Ktedonobacterales bacterium]